MVNGNDYIYFVLDKNGNANYNFTAFTDKGTGILMQIFKGTKHKGEDVPKRWHFDRAHRTIRVHKNDASIFETVVGYANNGKEIRKKIKSVDFLRGYPSCKDSPNGDGSTFMFSEIKEEADAITAIDAKKIKNKAETLALNLEGGDLKEMAVLCRCFAEGEAIQQHRVADFAGANPEEFLALYETPDRSAKALLQKASSMGIVTQRGTLFIWDNVTLGTSADLAVSKLMEDEDLAKALRQEVKSKNV